MGKLKPQRVVILPRKGWQSTVIYNFNAMKGRRLLAVSLFYAAGSPDQLPWLLAAVETVRPPSKGPTVTAEAAADVVFDDHSHEVLGSYRSPLTAQRAGEKYAAAWLKRRPRKRCKCGPIAK